MKFRWVIPANDQIVLKVRFLSDEVGQIDQVCTDVYKVLALTMVHILCVDLHF